MGRQITHDEFVEQLKEINAYINVIGVYKNKRTNVDVCCVKDGHVWSANPYYLLKGVGCPKCSGKVFFTEKDYYLMMEEQHPNIEVIGRYIDSQTPILLRCKVDNHEWKSSPQNSIKKGTGCPMCAGNIEHTQETYEKIMKEKHPNITVIGKYVRFHEPVDLKCSCGYQWEGRPSVNIGNKEGGCPACCPSPRVVWEGNCIATKEPWMLEYFANRDDGFKYLPASNKKIDMICPNCKTIKRNGCINKLYYTHSVGCKKCSDGKTYGEKFVYDLLLQLGIPFDVEKTFSWSIIDKSKKRYDFYLKNTNTIIEVHGSQHYKETCGVFTKTLKEELALKNGIDNYIVIDCRVSKFEWLKQSIIKSELSNMFDLNDVNWESCEKSATNSIVYNVCEFKNKNKNSTLSEIAEHFNLCTATIGKYLKIGNKLGICVYDSNEQKRISLEKNVKDNNKKVYVFDENHNFITSFDCMQYIQYHSKELLGVQLYTKYIRKSIKRNRSYNGFFFSYKK